MSNPTPPYLITENDNEPYVAWDEDIVVTHAVEYAREHGNYSGMEDWDEDNMIEWIGKELAETGRLDLYISGHEGHEFRVRSRD